jgi:hypothetical protein
MAPRIGYTLHALQRMNPSACASDVRLVWRKDEKLNLGLVNPRGVESRERYVNLPSFCSPREVRLLAQQLLQIAKEYEQDNRPDPHEEVDW